MWHSLAKRIFFKEKGGARPYWNLLPKGEKKGLCTKEQKGRKEKRKEETSRKKQLAKRISRALHQLQRKAGHLRSVYPYTVSIIPQVHG